MNPDEIKDYMLEKVREGASEGAVVDLVILKTNVDRKLAIQWMDEVRLVHDLTPHMRRD